MEAGREVRTKVGALILGLTGRPTAGMQAGECPRLMIDNMQGEVGQPECPCSHRAMRRSTDAGKDGLFMRNVRVVGCRDGARKMGKKDGEKK